MAETAADLASHESFWPKPVMRPRQQVEHQLRAAILDGRMADGHKLPSEAKLAEQFQVSRATIREALRSLSEAGLISTTPGAGGGSHITYFDHHRLARLVSERLSSTLELGSITFEEVTAFRRLLEVPAARLAAEHRTEEQLAALREAVDRAKQLPVDSREAHEANGNFHRILGEATGNRLLATFIDVSLTVSMPVDLLITPVEGTESDVRHDHHQMAEAIAARDADQAERLARAHLEALEDYASRQRSLTPDKSPSPNSAAPDRTIPGSTATDQSG